MPWKIILEDRDYWGTWKARIHSGLQKITPHESRECLL